MDKLSVNFIKICLLAIFFSMFSQFANASGHTELSITRRSIKTNEHIIFSPGDRDWGSQLKSIIEHHLELGTLKDTLFIEFKTGTYFLNQPIKLVGKSLQTNSGPILLKGTGRVVFSGGRYLKNSLLTKISSQEVKNRIISKDAREKVLEYDLIKDSITSLGELKCIGFGRIAGVAPPQLFCDEQRMTLARYPNAGDPLLLKDRTKVIPILKVINPGSTLVDLPLDANNETNSVAQHGTFGYVDSRVEKWVHAEDPWVDGIFTRDWSWSLNKIRQIDTAAKSITLEFDEKYNLTNKNSFFFACNLLEEIDVPGEYYIDKRTDKLYIYPPNGFNIKTSTLQITSAPYDLLTLDAIENITFENICFELGRYRAVNVSDCKNISFKNCEFKNFGISAIAIKGNDNNIEKCRIHAIGGTAISLDGGSFETLKKSNNKVFDCDIYDWAYYNRVYTPAIALTGVGNIVLRNKLHQAPHGAITVSGNDHLIENNEIYDVLLEFRDFGAIYGFLGKNQLMRGQTIRGNYFHNIGQLGDGVYAIYADEATAGWTIEGNLFYKIGHAGARVAGVMTNTGSYILVKNNIFLDCSETFELSFHFSTWGKKRYTDYFLKAWQKQYTLEGSIPSLYLERYPELKAFMKEERIYVSTDSFIGNQVGNFNLPLNQKGYFKTQSDIQQADNLVQSSQNVTITDHNITDYLELWNQSVDRRSIKKTIPFILKGYLKFIE